MKVIIIALLSGFVLTACAGEPGADSTKPGIGSADQASTRPPITCNAVQSGPELPDAWHENTALMNPGSTRTVTARCWHGGMYCGSGCFVSGGVTVDSTDGDYREYQTCTATNATGASATVTAWVRCEGGGS